MARRRTTIGRTVGRPQVRGFGSARQPVPFRAPPGSYDPGLDAAERASQRGLADLLEDTGTANTRDFRDYTQGAGDLNRQRDEGLADLLQGRGRFERDLGTARTRGVADFEQSKGRLLGDYTQSTARAGEDYGRNIGELDRGYGRLRDQQGQAAQQAGAASGGALAQAVRKRTENQAWDRAPIDTNFKRGNQDRDENYKRQTDDVNEGMRRQGADWDTQEWDRRADWSQQQQRLGDDTDRGLGRLAQQTSDRWDDRNKVQVPRAQRENQFFGQDTQEARIGSVRQTAPNYFNEWIRQNAAAGVNINRRTGRPIRRGR